MRPPIFLLLLFLLTRRPPRILETWLTGQPVGWHRNGSRCRTPRHCSQLKR